MALAQNTSEALRYREPATDDIARSANNTQGYSAFDTPDLSPHEKVGHPGDPIIVIGTGPVGVHLVNQLLASDAGLPILIFGNEPFLPYNRIKLSTLVAGETTLSDIDNEIAQPLARALVQHHGCAIVSIDRENNCVHDEYGNRHAYSQLVLATGAAARLPDLPGVNRDGVFTFRNLRDAQKLSTRKIRTRCTVVLGGGLLGLEAARAMAQFGTRVIVIEWSATLMVRQLDDRASQMLRVRLSQLGVETRTDESLTEILGDVRLAGVRLRSGETIDCDTLILATGIVPNVELARQAGLSIGKGIRVNSQLQTSDDNIFAIGECCEYGGHIYGLLAPGLEQAGVAANVIQARANSQPQFDGQLYGGSSTSAFLKVAGVAVCSFGRTDHNEPGFQFKTLVYHDEHSGTYRKLYTLGGRLVGAIGIGDWPNVNRIRRAARDEVTLLPWQKMRFENTGKLWNNADNGSVVDWSDDEIVCQCMGISKSILLKAVDKGSDSAQALRCETGASSVCGSCSAHLQQLAGSPATVERTPAAGTLSVFGALALIYCAALLLFPAVPYASSSSQWTLDWLWRDGFYKQVTGFSLLGTSLLLALISLPKRLPSFQFGSFNLWRAVHVVSGAGVIALLLAHTGLRIGSQLNMWLMLVFCALLAAGAAASLSIGLQHHLPASAVSTIRRQSIWWHVVLLIPIPALLGFHILKTYWF